MKSKVIYKSFVNKISLESFKKFEPYSKNYVLERYFDGKWQKMNKSDNFEYFPDPLNHKNPSFKYGNGENFFVKSPKKLLNEESDLIEKEMKEVPCSGLHNPLKKVDRYVTYGNVCRKVSEALHDPIIFNHFCDLICTVFPKSSGQVRGEMAVTRAFFDNFSGDNVRYLAKGFHSPGDHSGQNPTAYRWPYGPVAVIAPFNFPLEIPILQVMGALFMGNKPILKGDSKVALPLEEFVRLLLACGMPKNDLILLHSDGQSCENLLLKVNPKVTLFTGSSKIAERLTEKLKGKVKLEDAGLDWKILGPDVHNEDYVAHFCDHDSFALSGQKCSAQSLLFVHENWSKTKLYEKIVNLARKRTYENKLLSPILSWSNDKIKNHIKKVLSVPGSSLIYGGEVVNEKLYCPDEYGTFLPTIIKVPLDKFFDKDYKDILHTELFGPFYLVTEYKNEELNKVIDICDNLEQKLTCGVVSNDVNFLNNVLGRTSNGTTYAGIRARTTGAPQNHWFGPGGDPRGGGIGSYESIQLVWSHHREIVYDYVIPNNLSLTQS